ncbi:hypothetical protein [Haloarchaeobius iranensis]|nr:hypothetical protein [Haloarchaeobius iranensis]
MYAIEGNLSTDSDRQLEGFATENGNFLATASYPFYQPDNIWIHEYIHTRQRFAPIAGAQWTTEGTATYLAARLSLEQGLTSPREYDAFLARTTLLSNSTSLNQVDDRSRYAYLWGAAALSTMEYELSASNTSVGDAVEFMNSQRTVSQTELDRWTDERTRDNYSLDSVVFAQQQPTPRYLLGPSWLSPQDRHLIPYLQKPLVRLASLAFSLLFLHSLVISYTPYSITGSISSLKD